MTFSIFRRNTKAKAEEVNDNFAFIAGDRLIGFDTLTAQAKGTFEIGDLTAITNGSLVGDILLREGSNIKIYNESGAFIRNVGLDVATTTALGQLYINKPIQISNNVSDPDHDIDSSAGNFAFDDGSGMAVVSALTKRLDANWVAGNNQGGLDTGTVANDTWYYRYAIYNPTTGTSDILFTATYGSPTLPSGFTKKAYKGALLTDGSANIIQGKYEIFGNGYKFLYSVPLVDLDVTNPGTLGQLRTLSTPFGIETIPIAVYTHIQSAAGGDSYSLVTSPSQADSVPGFSLNTMLIGAESEIAQSNILISTNTSSQIRTRNGASTNSGTRMIIDTYGWIDNN